MITTSLDSSAFADPGDREPEFFDLEPPDDLLLFPATLSCRPVSFLDDGAAPVFDGFLRRLDSEATSFTGVVLAGFALLPDFDFAATAFSGAFLAVETGADGLAFLLAATDLSGLFTAGLAAAFVPGLVLAESVFAVALFFAALALEVLEPPGLADEVFFEDALWELALP